MKPDVAEYHQNLGETYRRAGRWEGAISSFRRALEIKPESAEAHIKLGLALQEAGRLEEALVALRVAIAQRPDVAEVETSLGNVLRVLGRSDEALAAYARAIEKKPDHAEAHNNRGAALFDRGRLTEAIAAYGRALELSPEYADAHNNRGAALFETGRLAEAIAAYGRALELQPDFAEAYNNLGSALHAAGRLDEAIAAYDRAVALSPDYAEAHNNRGNVFKDQGHIDQALACFRKAVELQPDFRVAASNLLFAVHLHPGYDAPAILAEHRRWARRQAEPLAASVRPHPNDRTPDRRLRIGFVSPDFHDHPVGQSLLPLFTHRDRLQTEIIGYSDVRVADPITAKLQALADEWHSTVGLPDAEVADRIRAERIDILVDLALHTAHNRLLVFARKPAPVQVSMLGMASTTGLATMDYRLTDPYLDPAGSSDADYTERSIRLSRCYWCYQPMDGSPPVGELPARKNGFVTFGCLNQFAKVSRPALEVWLTLLRSLPTARLVLHSLPGSHREGVHRLFQDAGISGDRVEFTSKAPRLSYLERYHDLDLCLDPFPYNGAITTMDSLWMGVPVVTLAGHTEVGRAGVSILTNVGLPELIADTPGEYVAIAAHLAGDWARLSELRAGLRPRMRTSPLLDGKGYTADVEAAFRRMWTTWCEQ